jgi:hypothetical protein
LIQRKVARRDRRAELLCNRLHDGARARTGDRIVHRLTVAARAYDALAAKDGEMLRNERLADAQGGGERADRLLAFDQPAHNHEPVRAGERLQEFAGLVGRPMHITEY